ncbi:MAG: hypothetical protein QNJ98_12035 [Planctomycetota bacterium]|nr:hypothetical protein [Planctomycetota bacterium]
MARGLLIIFLGALGLTALLLLALVVNDGDLGEGTVNVLLVALSTACAAVIAMAGEGGLRFRGTKALGVVTLVAALVAYLLIMSWILGGDHPTRSYRSFTWTAVTMATSLGLTCALVFIPLLEQWRIVRAATLFMLAGLCVGVLTSIWERGSRSDGMGRFTAVCGILFLVGCVLVLVGRDQSRKAMVKEEGGVKLPRCPHCGEELPKDLADVFH